MIEGVDVPEAAAIAVDGGGSRTTDACILRDRAKKTEGDASRVLKRFTEETLRSERTL